MSSVMPPQNDRFDSATPIVAVVLAGGRGLRLGGGDKALRLLAGRPLLTHVLARVVPQVDEVVLNANGDPARFAAWGLPVVADGIGAGPLAGVLAGLRWAQLHRPRADVLVVPTDTPFLPADLILRLRTERGPAPLACAASGGRLHPVVALWPVALRDDLRDAVTKEGLRKIEVWTARHGVALAAWPAEPVDPFFNVNTPEDAAAADRIATQYPDA